MGEISSQSRSLFKGTKKKKTECLHVGTVLFVGSVFVGTEFLFDCRVGLFGTLHVGTVLFVGSVFVGTEFLFDCRVGLLGTGVGEGVGGVVGGLFALGWLVFVI